MALVFYEDFEGAAGSIVGRTTDGLTWENGYGNNGSFSSEAYSTPPNLDGSGHLTPATTNFNSSCRIALPSSFFDGSMLTLEVDVASEMAVPENNQYMAIRFENTADNADTFPCLLFNYSSGAYRLTYGGGLGSYTPLNFAGHIFKIELDFANGLMNVYDQTTLAYSLSLPTPSEWLTVTLRRVSGGTDPRLTLNSLKMYTDDSEDPPEPPSPSVFWTDFVATREIP